MCKPCIAKAKAAQAAKANGSPIATVKATAKAPVGRPRINPRVVGSSTKLK